MATLLAFAVKDSGRFEKKFFRITYYLPAVLSITVVAQLWLSMYNAEYGLINKIFELMGLEYRQKLAGRRGLRHRGHRHSQHLAVHRLPVHSFALRGQLHPEHYFEAAQIDGCSKFKAHLRITLPLMQESYKYCLIIAITGGLNAFATMNIMTGGGPGTSTYTLTYLMYRSAFKVGNYGYGCASAIMLVVQCLIVSIIINKAVARERIIY